MESNLDTRDKIEIGVKLTLLFIIIALICSTIYALFINPSWMVTAKAADGKNWEIESSILKSYNDTKNFLTNRSKLL